MSVQVTMSFPSFEAAQSFFASTAIVSGNVPVVILPTAPQPPAPAVEAVDTGPKKRAAKPKATVESAQPAPTPETPVPALDVAKGDPLPESMHAEAKVWTEDEVRATLKAVSEKHGLDAVRALLVEVCGKSRISEVPPEDYAKLAAAAQAKAAEEKVPA